MRFSKLVPFGIVIASLATASCASHEVTYAGTMLFSPDEPRELSDRNLMVRDMVAMALPDGWQFADKTEKEEAKDVLFWIRDAGSNSVAGALRVTQLDFDILLSRGAEIYGNAAMPSFIDKRMLRTEVDSSAAYVLFGTEETSKRERATMLVQVGRRTIVDISLFAEPNTFTVRPQLAYSIFSTFRTTPVNLSERRIKGTFSFKCEDARMRWSDDIGGRFQTKGYSVDGMLEDEYIDIRISQISSTRFETYVKPGVFNDPEFETELHLAGATYHARALASKVPGKAAGTIIVREVLIFKHNGQDYMLGLLRGHERLNEESDIKETHNLAHIRKALDSYFYYAE